jgi:hypothetical protein
MILGNALQATAVMQNQTISFVAATTSTAASSITIPAGIIAGDLLVLTQYGGAGPPAPTIVNPAGFTQMSSTNIGTTVSYSWSYKLATGTESALGSYTGLTNGTAYSYRTLQVFRRTPYPFIEVRYVFNGYIWWGNAAPSLLTATTRLAKPAILFGYFVQTSAMTGQVFTPTETGATTVSTTTVRYAIINHRDTLPTTYSITAGDGGSNGTGYWQMNFI